MLGNIQITEANIMSIRTNLIVADRRSVRILIERGNEPGDGVRFFDAEICYPSTDGAVLRRFDGVFSIVDEAGRECVYLPRYVDGYDTAVCRFRLFARGALAEGPAFAEELKDPLRNFPYPAADTKKGLVLITSTAGSGKSTTLACMIDRINRGRECHVITMEDPIEFIHRHDRSIVSQREISIDTPGYLDALRSALREAPDVILLGEMRDYDTISSAITAAETGVLLLSTLHTSSAANTINRILDVFPANQQKQVKIQLAQILKGVVCQQLVQGVDGNLIQSSRS